MEARAQPAAVVDSNVVRIVRRLLRDTVGEAPTLRAVQEIRREAVDLSVTIASKLLERHVSKADNERLINDTLEQIENSSQ